MTRRAIATRERILQAALTRFSGYGFRRTSMEDLAVEAGVSRAALYLQFRNKEEIFRALAQQLHDAAVASATAAAQGAAPLDERLRAAVEAKMLPFVAIAYGSPHGGELLDESNRLCGDLAADSQRRFLDILVRTLRRATRAGEIDLERVGLSAPTAADLFAAAVGGLKGPGVTVEVYRRRVAALVRVFLAGMGIKARAPRRPLRVVA